MVWREESGGREGAFYAATDSTAWIMRAGVVTWWTDARAVGHPIEAVAKAIHDLRDIASRAHVVTFGREALGACLKIARSGRMTPGGPGVCRCGYGAR